MAQWGFNFARLPCSYLIWSNKLNWMSVDELALQPLDQAIQWGRQYKIHINLNLHHVPGYGSATERYQLFNSPHELNATGAASSSVPLALSGASLQNRAL